MVCAGMVCAATPGTARVGPAGPTSAVPGVSILPRNSEFLFYHENEATHND